MEFISIQPSKYQQKWLNKYHIRKDSEYDSDAKEIYDSNATEIMNW